MLKFNNKELTDFNIKIENNLTFTAPETDVEFHEIKGLDGDIAVDNQRLKGFDRSFPFGLDSPQNIENDFELLANFLKKDTKWHELEWGGSPNYVYLAMYQEEINLERVVRTFGKGVLNFRFKPLKYLKSSMSEVLLGSSINNPTNRKSKPKLIIKGSGDISIKIGKSELSLKGVDGGVIVDSQSQTITDLTGERSQFNKMTSYPFPAIEPGNNIIVKTGSITSVTIIPRFEVVAT